MFANCDKSEDVTDPSPKIFTDLALPTTPSAASSHLDISKVKLLNTKSLVNPRMLVGLTTHGSIVFHFAPVARYP